MKKAVAVFLWFVITSFISEVQQIVEKSNEKFPRFNPYICHQHGNLSTKEYIHITIGPENSDVHIVITLHKILGKWEQNLS